MVYAKKGRGNAVADTVSVDGEVMNWEPISEPRWSTDGYVGLRISVRVDAHARELIVEFPYTRTQNGRPRSWPHRPREFKILLEEAVRLAIEAGFEPNSRGRPFVFQVPDNPEDPSRPDGHA